MEEAEVERCIRAGNLNCLKNCPFVLAERIGSAFRIASRMFQHSGYAPLIRCWSSSMTAVCRLAFSGEGACFAPGIMLPAVLAPEERRQLLVFRSPDRWEVPITFLYSKESYQRETVADFITAVRESFGEDNRLLQESNCFYSGAVL